MSSIDRYKNPSWDNESLAHSMRLLVSKVMSNHLGVPSGTDAIVVVPTRMPVDTSELVPRPIIGLTQRGEVERITGSAILGLQSVTGDATRPVAITGLDNLRRNGEPTHVGSFIVRTGDYFSGGPTGDPTGQLDAVLVVGHGDTVSTNVRRPGGAWERLQVSEATGLFTAGVIAGAGQHADLAAVQILPDMSGLRDRLKLSPGTIPGLD